MKVFLNIFYFNKSILSFDGLIIEGNKFGLIIGLMLVFGMLVDGELVLKS